MHKIILTCGVLLLTTFSSFVYAVDGLGQTIQIYTQFHSFVGRPTWLLIIRDIDNGQNLPYLYDVRKGDNFWLAFTYGRNYLILTSTMHFSPYRHWPWRSRKIENFCNLESDGRIIRGESLYITLSGDLTPNTCMFSCDVMQYPDSNFTVVTPGKL